jgi:hypothetical protein
MCSASSIDSSSDDSRFFSTVAQTMTYTLLRCLPVTFLLTRSYAFILTSVLYQVAHKEQLAAVAMAAREVALKNGRSDHERIAALEQQSQLLQAQLRTAEQRCDDLRDQVGCTKQHTLRCICVYPYSMVAVDCEVRIMLHSWWCLSLIKTQCSGIKHYHGTSNSDHCSSPQHQVTQSLTLLQIFKLLLFMFTQFKCPYYAKYSWTESRLSTVQQQQRMQPAPAQQQHYKKLCRRLYRE